MMIAIRKGLKGAISMLLIACLLLGSCLAEGASLDDIQKNAIAMLNYITVLTKEINASKNSRLYLEEAYSSLINNTHPNSVDSRTLSQLAALLDVMESYRMVEVKRNRLQYIYEQNKAQAIRSAVPDPLALLSTVKSFRPTKLALSIAYMGVDSLTSYVSFTEEGELKHLMDDWALDDEEAAILHESRKSAFSYMIQMVGDYNLPGDLTLTENLVDEFVKWKMDDNVVGRIQFLESNHDAYQSYGGYWLLLAESYYNNENYAKALEALKFYENLDVRIFRKDYELARILPLMVSAAEEVYQGDAYVEAALKYAEEILENTDHDDWALRYFVAQTYIDVYAQTNEKSWLMRAYEVALDNVNYLVGEQRAQNETYINPLQEVSVPKGTAKKEKKQINEYNKALKEARKRELPPVYEPLLLNCDLLFALAGELDVSKEEKTKIEGILHPGGTAIFLNDALDEKYWFEDAPASVNAEELDVQYEGNSMAIPANMVMGDGSIHVTVKEADGSEAVFEDWTLQSVHRETEGDIATYLAIFESEAAREHDWKVDEQILVDVHFSEGLDLGDGQYEFTTRGTKQEWYDYFKVWEGHKNNWYDYGKVWENSVVFERVK